MSAFERLSEILFGSEKKVSDFKVNLSTNDFNRIHDCLIEKWPQRGYTNEEISIFVGCLPSRILVEATHWGWSDTVVCDHVIGWINSFDFTSYEDFIEALTNEKGDP